MRVAVLVKQVPDVTELRLDPVTRTLVREGVPSVMNMYDRTALSRAMRFGDEQAAEVVAVSMGPPAAVDVLRECLAAGGARAILVSDRCLAGSDTWITARVLAATLDQIGPFDLVLCGQHSTDSETGQVGPEVAALLGLEVVTGAVRLDIEADRCTAVRELDGGIETVAFRLPALVSVVEAMLKPRRVLPAALREVAADRVEVWDVSRLGIARAEVGLDASPTLVREVRADAPLRLGLVLGDAAAAGELVDRLLDVGAFSDRTEEGVVPAGPVRPRTGPCVLVVAEAEDGRLHRGVLELLGEASRTAIALGGWVAALGLGDGDVAALAAHGADLVLSAPCDYDGAGWAERVLAATRLLDDVAVVMAPASARCREVMPRVAARLGAGLVGDAIGIEVDGGVPLALKPAFGGVVVAPIESRTRPLLTTIRPGICLPLHADPGRRVEMIVLDCPPARSAVRVGAAELDPEAAVLAGERGIVVCAGWGVGGPEGVEEVRRLALDLGASLAGTRRVVDSGWLPRGRQVGVSGHALASRLYIGVAVRGAANHLVGLRRVRTVVGINSDPTSSLFAAADYGLVCDWREGVEALRNALRERGLLRPPVLS